MDDVTKGEYTFESTGVNASMFTRKKSGLKPLKPTSIGISNLNSTTPGKFPHTPGKFLQTPKLNFKENEHSRLGKLEFPSTPK